MPVKKKPRNADPFHRNKHAALYYDGDNDKFVCAFGYQPLPGGEYSFNKEYICDNPMEAIMRYEDSFCPGLRIAYGDWLERKIGYHRYTGEKLRREED